MPASLFHENQEQINQNIQNTNVSSVNGIEEQRALQLALELSVFGLMNDEDSHLNAAIDAEARLKKSQNTTECVPVPSSEHVAEIVGRQGCKIKALRAKTNTYIKTPVRGEEPVFVVTGRKEDVNSAKREILSAAEHFSQIRAQRKSTIGGVVGAAVASALSETNTSLTNSVCNATGQCTIQVRVPYRVVGLVVGPKGATIKRIQQQTSTYIITPSREKEPIFEVTGLPDNVQTARKEIEAHIAIRTGDVIDSGSSGNGSSQADDLDTRDYLSNSPQQFGSFVEQLYGSSSVNNGQQTGSSSNAANVAAVAAKLNGLQLLQNCNSNNNSVTNNSNSFSNIFASAASLAALNNNSSNGSTTNGLSLLYSKTNGSLENSFSPFSLNGLGASNKNSDLDNNCSNLFNNFGVDALARNNLLNHNVNGNSGGASTINSLSSGSSNSSTSSNGNLNASNNLMNLCNSTGLNMLNLQNAKNLLSVNSKFADIYSQLLANNNNITSSTSNNNSSSNHNHHLNNHSHQLLQHHHLNNAASAVVNQLSNALGQLNVNNVSNSNHSNNATSGNNSNNCSLTGNSAASNLLNSSNNSTGANTLNGTGNNSFNVNSLYERDEGIGDSPTFDSIAAANLATLTNNLAVMASVNSSNHSSNSSGLGSSNGLLSGLTSSSGNSSSASSVNSTNNSVSLWPDFSSATSNTVNNSTTNINNPTNNQCNTNSTTMNNSSNSTNVSTNVANSLATVTSISTAQQQQVSRA